MQFLLEDLNTVVTGWDYLRTRPFESINRMSKKNAIDSKKKKNTHIIFYKMYSSNLLRFQFCLCNK